MSDCRSYTRTSQQGFRFEAMQELWEARRFGAYGDLEMKAGHPAAAIPWYEMALDHIDLALTYDRWSRE